MAKHVISSNFYPPKNFRPKKCTDVTLSVCPFNKYIVFLSLTFHIRISQSSDVDAKVMDPKLTEKIIYRAETYKRKDALPKGIELWMGETGGAYGSGRNEVTNRFMSAFWYLDWLGVFSRLGYGGFCRQTLIGGNYGLLQIEKGEYFLNPDYFGALLFTHVMKGHIVKMNSSSEIHQYATIKRDGDHNAVYFGLLGTHSNLLI